MSLTIIGGLPGSDTAARARAVESGGALIVVPSSRYAARVRTDLAEACPVGLRVAGIDGLVESEWLRSGDGRRIVSPTRRRILLRRALESTGVAARPGRGAVALLGTIATRACAQGVADHAHPPGLSGRLTNGLDRYLSDLAGSGLIDKAEATRRLAGVPAPASTIVVEGLVSFTPDREQMLVGWARAGADVVVSLPWSPGCPATAPLDALVARFVAAGAVIELASSMKDGRPQELERIAEGLFAGARPELAEGHVELGMAAGDEAESRLIAERVRTLRSKGVSGERIAVAFSDPSRHAGWLRRAFDDAGIDAAWEIRTPVTETPLGRSMLRLWSFATGGMHREDLAAFMRSPFSGVEAADVDRADVAWRLRRYQGPDLLAQAGRARSLVAACSREALRPLDIESANNWKRLGDRLLENAYGREAPIPGMDGALDAAVHRAFCQVLGEAVEQGDGDITAADLWDGFADSTVSPASAEGPDRVLVTSLEGLNGRIFEAVVIGGLTAGETPKQGSDDRLEGEAVRGALRALGLGYDADEQVRMERFGFYLAVTSATRSLTLVRQETDDEGRALRASVFWEEFLDLYREPGTSEDDAAGIPAVHRRGSDHAASPCGVSGVARGLLVDEAVLAELAAIDAVSPGDVERYAACPYRWFVERRLKPRTPDTEIDVLIAGQVAHKALADFYREWTLGCTHSRVNPETLSEALDRARAVVRTVTSGAPEPTSLDERWLLAAVEPAVLGLVERDARFLPEYEPTALEWSFGLDDGDEPIDLGGVRIKGRADRIDTGPEGLVVIDYKAKRAVTLADIRREGLVQLQLYAIAASSRMGLPVAGGLYRSLATSGDRGFVSVPIGGAFKAADVVDATGIEELLAGAVETARTAFEGMRAGRIAPVPSAERCEYCTAYSFCPQGARS